MVKKIKRIHDRVTLKLIKSLIGQDIFVMDTELNGFSVHVDRSGAAFYLRKAHGGKRIQKTIGRFPEMTVEEARAEAFKTIASFVNYETPDALVSSHQPTVGEAIDWYLKQLKHDSRFFFYPFSHLRNRKIAEVSRRDIIAVRDTLQDHPQKSNHCVRYLGTAINKFLKFLEIDLPNPALGIPQYHTEPRRRFLSESEAPKLVEELKNMANDALRGIQSDALLMMIYTGQRKSNVLHMNLKDIRDGVWVVPFSEAKSGRDIVVPLNEFALEIVQKYAGNAKQGYLFVRNGKVLADVRKTMLTACARAGIENCHIHDLRRTLGSWMLMNGTPIEVVSRTLGHSSIRVTEQVYAHLLPHKISDATGAAVRAMMSGKV